jgi:hypothetical protein
MNSFPGTTNAGNQINAAGVTRMARDQARRDAAIINAPATNIAPVTTNSVTNTNTSLENQNRAVAGANALWNIGT